MLTGWFGLAAAKAASQLMPDQTMAIFESSETPGGTWSKHRLYPGLKSNNMIGTYEYPDFPMLESKYGVKHNTHIPGTVLNQYLTDFATTSASSTKYNSKPTSMPLSRSKMRGSFTSAMPLARRGRLLPKS